MREEKIEAALSFISDSSWILTKWFLIQNFILFLMPFIMGYNMGLSLLIGIYTVVFGLFFLSTKKERWVSYLILPYSIYVILALICHFTWRELFPSIWFSMLFPLYGAACLAVVKRIKHYINSMSHNRIKQGASLVAVIIVMISIKCLGAEWWCRDHGSIDGEKREILERRDYLNSRIIREPARVLGLMPSSIGEQFQGEWALYSCSMLSSALANISSIYPETKVDNLRNIDSLIQIVISPELRKYDKDRWGEDPLTSLDSDKSHMSYLSHLAWMISGYKAVGGDKKYDRLFSDLCRTMNRRMLQSKSLNLATYPDEPIYIPDMLVAVVALSHYSKMNGGQYSSTVNRWIKRAKTEWLDKETGLLVSFLEDDGSQIEGAPIKGSYSALNCSYLSYIDEGFAQEQYNRLKSLFWKDGLVSGFKEYHDSPLSFGFDIDAGPIVIGLSPSGTAFALGAVTYFGDDVLRNRILKTAELAGHTISWNNKRHYALADIALVGEAITLAMRTNYKECRVHGLKSSRSSGKGR